MEEISMLAPGWTLSTKLPSQSVMAPFCVPLSMTLAPMTGPIASVTFPVIRTVCAIAPIPIRSNTNEAKSLLFMLQKVGFG